jgi:hypothetical protein
MVLMKNFKQNLNREKLKKIFKKCIRRSFKHFFNKKFTLKIDLASFNVRTMAGLDDSREVITT